MSDDDSTSANSLEEQIAQSELEILEAKRRIAEIRLKKQISSRNNSVLSASNKSLSRSSGSKSGSSVNGSKSSQSTTSASPANGSSRSHGSQITVPEGPKPSASPTGSTKAVQDAVPDWADADAGEQVTLTVAAKEHWKDEPFKRFDVRYTKGVPATLQTVWSAFAQGKQAGERTDTWRVFVNGKERTWGANLDEGASVVEICRALVASPPTPVLEPMKSMPMLNDKAKAILGADAVDLRASSAQLGAHGRASSAPIVTEGSKDGGKGGKEDVKKEKRGAKESSKDKREREREEKEKEKVNADTLRKRGFYTPDAEISYASHLRTPLKDFKKILKEIKKGDTGSVLATCDAKTGASLIHFAARSHAFEHLHAILDKDATLIDRRTDALETPLHWLCQAATDVPEDRLLMLKSTLKELGAPMREKQDVSGRTPLYVAVNLNLVNIVKALLLEGSETLMSFVPEFISVPNLASSAAVEIYRAIDQNRAQETAKGKRVQLFATARNRPSGPPRPRICFKNHPLVLAPGEKFANSTQLPETQCMLCGDAPPQTLPCWQCKESGCHFAACPGCMPLGAQLAQDEALYMFNTFIALVPEDIKLLPTWRPLQHLQRLAHARARSVCEAVGRYYLRCEARPGTVVKTGVAEDHIQLVNLGATEAEWRLAATHPPQDALLQSGVEIALITSERAISDGRLGASRTIDVGITVTIALASTKRVRAVLALAVNPVSDKSQVDLLFFFVDTTVTRVGPSDRRLITLMPLAPAAAAKRDPNAPLPVRQAIAKPGALPEEGAERGLLVEYCPSEDDPHWSAERVWIKMEDKPLAAGNLREAFKTTLWRVGTPSEWVTKVNKSPEDHNRRAYELDVITQTTSASFTHRYNSKKSLAFPNIAITAAYLLEFIDRPDRPVYAVERFMPGEYLKFNNNYGWTGAKKMSGTGGGAKSAEDKALELAEWTAAAFSHFTFLESKGQMMVVDIQGVGQNYTDPQIHTADGKGFGKGNQAVKGMLMFKQSHNCNAICKDMGITDNWSVEGKRFTSHAKK